MIKKEKIKILNGQIEKCKKCPLCRSRINPVSGEGSLSSKILLIGEAPGLNEDLQKKPFVGRTKEVLNTLLSLSKLSREDIYITNIVKCRPPKNRVPKSFEVKTCFENYLKNQILILKPTLIITLGHIASKTLAHFFQKPFSHISKEHGKIESFSSPFKGSLFYSFHPAYSFYKPEILSLLKKDFMIIKNV